MDNFFYKNLLFLRESRKESQRALADELGISKSLISQYERGESDPTLTVLIKIARYFGCTLDEITSIDLSKKTFEYSKKEVYDMVVREEDPEYNAMKLKIENDALKQALREIGKGLNKE